MYIVSDKQLTTVRYLSYLPPSLKRAVMETEQDGLCEIRVRRSRPVILHYTDRMCYLAADGGITDDAQSAYTVGARELARACETAFEFSLYAHEDELSQGYITIRGGHRIGLCGEVKSGKIRSFTDVTSMNYRIAHEHIGIAEALVQKLTAGNRVSSTLIISPPMCGKTSLLRDIVRILSLEGRRVGVCDTRGEIAAVYDGEPGMDIGNADILSGAEKADGMRMLLRTMAPEIIACDELGSTDDTNAVSEIMTCGVSIIATAHCSSREELFSGSMGALASKFDCIVTLGGIGKILEVYHV